VANPTTCADDFPDMAGWPMSIYTHLRVAASIAISGLQLFGGTAASALEPTDAQRAEWRRPDTIPFPQDNPYTPEKATLGKMLFFDTRLSRDMNLSCASCHNPSFGWEVPFAKAIGAGGKPIGRHAPTTVNLAWSKNYFWDGRAPTLETQAKGPIEAAVEMDLPMATAVSRLKEVQGYVTAFDRAFPKEGLNENTVLKSIATYERTLVTGDTPFDRWMRGDTQALSTEAKRGFALFAGKANCSACHSGWNFSDDKFHDIGLPTADVGRMELSQAESDRHAFKTPGLREIAARAPYMHQGEVASLEAVIAHYVGGGLRRPSLSPLMKPVLLGSQEIQDLAAFMRTLSSPQTTLAMPNLPSH
jgi:cytochrome c peroxidase